MNKLKAFTILELVIALAIMSVVATIAYTVAESSQLQFHSYKNGQSSLAQVAQLNSLLHQDADRCIRVNKSRNGVTFFKPTDTTSYAFEDDLIVRIQSGQADTFAIPQNDFAAFFNGEAQLLPGALVDHIQFIGYLDESAFPMAAHKHYDARLLLENELKE